jgi:hypothetical protein
LNELLLSQIEAAEEGRVFSDRTTAEISTYRYTQPAATETCVCDMEF